ncbi:MAG: HD domain-containing protein [Kofleriaceae bacterium]|nr:HD domain-containing protein [Kofleriaceae bacterium]
MSAPADASPVRLAEAVGALSLATDLANGFPLERTLHATVLATRVAAALGLPGDRQRDVYYTAVLRFIGCTAYGPEEARLAGGDDIALRHALLPMDPARPRDAAGRLWRGLGGTRRARAGAIARAVADRGGLVRHRAAACDAAVRLAAPMPVPAAVPRALTHVFEHVDGGGLPGGLAGDDIAEAARVVAVADLADQLARAAGVDAAVAELRRRAGRQLDAAIVAAVVADAPALLAGPEGSPWRAYLDAEPAPALTIAPARLDDVARGFGRFADLRSPFTLGHADAVATLAEAAARQLGVDDATCAALRRAALLHDVGSVAVPLGTWHRAGPLDAVEQGRVRDHAAQTERILAVCPALTDAAPLAGAHHERLDGSGYHRGLGATRLDVAARVLAAADVWHALGQDRPHRPGWRGDDAVAQLVAEARAGRLDAPSVDAVLAVAGRPAAAVPWPAHLSDREVEVLRLVAIGRTNPEIGRLLGISAKTVQHHVSHVFDKLGVASRAGAALAAVELGLLP